MSVRYRYADTLRRNQRRACFNNLAILNPAPDAQRLLLALLLFPADIRNDVVQHFRPIAEVFTSSGNRLICRCDHGCRFKIQQGMQSRDIALDGAIGFNGNKPSLRSKPFALRGNDFEMLRVYFRDHHRYIRRPAMSRIVGNDRGSRFCISLF
ncbi:hypothetical protein D3C77_562030 [compost metagenome]